MGKKKALTPVIVKSPFSQNEHTNNVTFTTTDLGHAFNIFNQYGYVDIQVNVRSTGQVYSKRINNIEDLLTSPRRYSSSGVPVFLYKYR